MLQLCVFSYKMPCSCGDILRKRFFQCFREWTIYQYLARKRKYL